MEVEDCDEADVVLDTDEEDDGDGDSEAEPRLGEGIIDSISLTAELTNRLLPRKG